MKAAQTFFEIRDYLLRPGHQNERARTTRVRAELTA